MKNLLLFISISVALVSCQENQTKEAKKENNLSGTWQLISSKVISKGDTANTFDSKNHKMIKVFNETHFAFFKHDLNKGTDSSAVYDSGSGTYKLDGDQYSEHLEYCNYRGWENHDFNFTLTIQNDSLTQKGVEKIDSLNIDQEIIEKYVRVQ